MLIPNAIIMFAFKETGKKKENCSNQFGWINNRVIEVLTKNCVNLYQSPNFLVPTLALYFSC